jgi:hypothetical protein
MHLEAMQVQNWTIESTWRMGSGEMEGAHRGHNRASMEEYWEAVNLEGGKMAAENLVIG